MTTYYSSYVPIADERNRACPRCGATWESDCDLFGCWHCGCMQAPVWRDVALEEFDEPV
jgi:predicted  nucleic acid-binding Zn ribbon protein